MNRDRNPTKSLLCCALALALVSTAAAQGSMEGAAKVIRLKGSARYSMGNYVWQPIKVGDILRPGAVVQTSADEGSYVDLALGEDNAMPPQPATPFYRPSIVSSMAMSTASVHPSSEQNMVRVWGDSALALDKLNVLQTGADRVTETQIDLKRGRITGNVKKLSAASKYEVKFPNGVAGIRGTIFDIQAVGIVKVYIGSMVVAWVDPRTQNATTQTIMGGQFYDTSSNQISLLSMDSIGELERLSSTLVVTQVLPTPTMLASDHTVVGMSPVGANPGSLPAAGTPTQTEGGDVFSSTPAPPSPPN